jgi:hypothetical protein
MKTYQKNFYLKEYESLRKELEFLSNDLRNLEKYVIFSIAAIWSWLLTQTTPEGGVDIKYLKLAWRGIPLILSVFGIARAASLYVGIQKISTYLRGVENDFGIIGWEKTNKGIPCPFIISLVFIWIAILAVSYFFPNPFAPS